MKKKMIAVLLGLSVLLMVPAISLAGNKVSGPPAGAKKQTALEVKTKQVEKVAAGQKQEVKEKLQNEVRNRTQVKPQGAIRGTIQAVKKIENGFEITFCTQAGKILVCKADDNTVVSFRGSLGNLLGGRLEGQKALVFCDKNGVVKWLKVLPPATVGEAVYDQQTAVSEQ